MKILVIDTEPVGFHTNPGTELLGAAISALGEIWPNLKYGDMEWLVLARRGRCGDHRVKSTDFRLERDKWLAVLASPRRPLKLTVGHRGGRLDSPCEASYAGDEPTCVFSEPRDPRTPASGRALPSPSPPPG